MKWIYNDRLGCFEREDKIGKKIWVTMSEAQRIITLRDLGNSIGEIQAKMTFVSSKASSYSVKTILEKVDDDSLIIDMDVPASDIQFNDLSVDNKLVNLEERISNLEGRLSEIKSDCFISAFEGEDKKEVRWKKWLRL